MGSARSAVAIAVATLKILIVDDCTIMRRCIRRMLQSPSYEIEEASNGSEGLARVASFEPQLILLDLGMPVMDGMAMLKQLRGAKNLTPVILVTAESSGSFLDELFAEGVLGHVPKPIDSSMLCMAVTAALKQA